MIIPPYVYISLFVHIISFVVGFGAVIVIDTFGFLWILKKVQMFFVMRVAEVTQKLIWIGWLGLVVSGAVMLFWKGHIDNLMWVKLFLVLMVGLNGIFLHRIKKSLERLSSDAEITGRHKFRIGLASSISQLGWWSALIIGFFHHNISHVINWPQNPLSLIVPIIALIFISLAAERFLLKT